MLWGGTTSEPLIVHVVDSDPSVSAQKSSTPMLKVSINRWLDKTWNEIANSATPVYLQKVSEVITALYPIGRLSIDDSEGVYAVSFSDDTEWMTTDANGYPKVSSL